MTIRDLQIQQEEVDKKFQTAREFTRGVLVAYQGSVDVPGRPFFVWAREYDQESSIFQAFNTTVSALEGLPVIIGRPWDIFSEYEVVSLDPIVANQPGLGTDPYLVEHAISHQWPAEDNVGADPVEVYQPAFQSFKTIPSSGMVVQVTFGPFVYHSLPFTYATSTVDLTANLPSAGKVRYVLLYVHKQTNALVVLEGLEAILTPIKPDIPGIALSSSYILLTDTTTTITTNEIEDAREMFTGGVNRNEIWMDIAPTGISHTEGQLSWNSVDKTLNVHSGFGNVVVQVGQETQYIVYNNTAGTLLDGRVVHLTGVFQGRVTVDYARSNSYITLEDTLGVLTMDIPPGEFGVGTVQGIVRGIDTSMFSLGQVWVSPTSTTGELTQTKPEFPNYDMSMGIITVVDATNGEITVSIISKASDTFDNAWNGTIRESFNFRVTSDGAIVTGTLAPRTIDANNPDLTMIFSDGFSTLDTLPPITITLIPGTDSTPTVNRVYIPKSTKALTVTTAAWPDVEIIRIAELFIPSAAQAQVDSVLININFTEHLQEVDNVGHMSHIGQKLRRLGSSWDSGITPSVSGTPSNVYLAVTAGVVWQLHPQVFSAKDMAVSDWAYVVNHPTVPYTRITNFNTQTLDALGVSLANSSFSVVLWGCQNREGETSHLFINLPIGSYRKNTPEDAVNDSNSFAIYDFPTEFQATGFLIARFTFTLDAGGTSWVLYSTEDLRGQSPSVSAGGGGGVSKWQVDANGINYQLGNVGIGAESSSGLHNLLILDAVFPAIRLEIPASSNNLTLLANSSGGSVASSANLTLGVALSNEVLIDISPKKMAKFNMAGLSIAGDADVGSGQWLQIAGIDQTYTVGGVQGIGINAFPQNTLSEGALFLNYTDNIPTQVNKVFITRNAFFQHTLNIENVLIAYRTSEGSGQFRTAFSMEGATDVVAVANRAPNGIVEIRANNATGGGGGEATIATFSRPTGTSYSQLDLNTDVLRLASSESNSTAGAGISTIDIRVANGQTKTVRFSSANGGIASNAGGVLFFSSINHLTDADKHIHGMYMLSMANFTQVAQLTTIIERLTGGTWSFTKTAGIAQVDFAFASTGGTMAIALWYIGVGDASWTLL